MTPNQLQDRGRALLNIYARVEERLLEIIARRLGDPDGTPVWVQRKLSEARKIQTEIQRALDALNAEAGALAEELIREAWAQGYESFLAEIRAQGIELEGLGIEANIQRADALIRDAAAQLDAVHTHILRETEDIYRAVLAEALPLGNAGAETTRQAMQRALNRFANLGITAFVDKAGRKWGMAEYAEMATRTGMMRAAISGYTQDAIEHGEDLVIVSDHSDECPLCAVWERKVLSLTGAQRNHPDCAGTVAEATAAGLFHPNCEHSLTVYIPGLTQIEGSKARLGITPAQDARGYQNRQKQRYMERTLRQWKRRQAAAMSPEEERKCKARVDMWRRRIREFTEENNLPRMRHREGGRVILSDAARKLKPIKL